MDIINLPEWNNIQLYIVGKTVGNFPHISALCLTPLRLIFIKLADELIMLFPVKLNYTVAAVCILEVKVITKFSMPQIRKRLLSYKLHSCVV